MHVPFLHNAVRSGMGNSVSRLSSGECTECQPKAANERRNCDILVHERGFPRRTLFNHRLALKWTPNSPID
jgi:hypothetical protein